MRVWVGYVDQGEYSDRDVTVRGVYSTPEVGQRAARLILQERIAKERTKLDWYTPEAWAARIERYNYRPEEYSEDRRLENIRLLECRIAAYEHSLIAPWLAAETTSVLPEDAIMCDAPDQWRFVLEPFDVEEEVSPGVRVRFTINGQEHS